jgi:alpha-ketoglutarate-dependent taurine dioxygenase
MSLQVRPLSECLGLEIQGLELWQDLSPETVSEIRELWQKSPVLVFPRQSLNEVELLRFSGYFGAPEAISRKDILSPYHDQVAYMSNFRYLDGRTVGAFADDKDVGWHSDQTFREKPATGAILYGVEVPPNEGAVHFANQYDAWERLPDEVKSQIDGRTGIFSYNKRLTRFSPAELKDKIEEMKKTPDVRHPVVLTHPVTGRKALYADPNTLAKIEGMSDADSDAIIETLVAYGTDKAVCYGHPSKAGDVVMWDNGCVLHRRDAVSNTSPRLMKRTTMHLPSDLHAVP